MTLQPSSRSVRTRRIAGPILLLGIIPLVGAASGDAGTTEEREAPATVTVKDGAVERPSARIVFGADTVHAEVAQTPDERAEGLMYREDLAEDAGMLFIFPESAVRGFWMQNTYIPLDIAFMDPSFRIVDIQQMEPMTTDQHTARAPFMYALEVNQGWFEARGIGVGAQAQVTFGR